MTTQEITNKIENLVNDSNFRSIVAKTVIESGIITANEWNSNREDRIATYYTFAAQFINN